MAPEPETEDNIGVAAGKAVKHRVQWGDTSDPEGQKLGNDKGKQRSVRWADDVNESSENAALKVKRKHRVRWADDVSDASEAECSANDENSVTVSITGALKQVLGRSKAKRWLLSQVIEMEGCMDGKMLREIAATFANIRMKEGADKDTVKSELLQILQVLTRDKQSCSGLLQKKAPAGVQKAKDQRRVQWASDAGEASGPEQEPEPEDAFSLGAAAAATAREWFQWYSLHLFRSG